ncbi:eCIS core domain-containing protein, partial [Halobiforma nitratireducens]
HTGPKAAEAADAIDAKAFTCGNAIVFNAGEYDPSSPEGQFLLAHELAHVKQQHGGAPISMMPKPNAELEIDPDPQLEREADQTAKEALSGEEPLTVSRMGTDVHIQRFENDRTAEFYEGVINAIRRESDDLDTEDIERIKSEVAEEIPGTEYDGAAGHDELNIKALEKAREAAAQKKEEMQLIREAEDKFASAEWGEKVHAAQVELGARDDESADFDEVADDDESPMDVVHEQAKLQKEYPEAVEKANELEDELESILGNGNIRLTEAQKEEIQSLEQKLAEKFDSPTARTVTTYLLNLMTDTLLHVQD